MGWAMRSRPTCAFTPDGRDTWNEAYGLIRAFTPDGRNASSEAYGLIASVMQEAVDREKVCGTLTAHVRIRSRRRRVFRR
jgi:hypothetical protein